MRQLLDLAGIGADRLQIRWVSAAEGQQFAEYIKDLSRTISDLGRFDSARFVSELALVEDVLGSPRLRWLVGMDRQLTQRENVFHEKIDAEKYKRMLSGIVEVEYQKALIFQALEKGPLSVREMALATGLPIYTVSLRLGELEKSGKADLHAYENKTPRFHRLAV